MAGTTGSNPHVAVPINSATYVEYFLVGLHVSCTKISLNNDGLSATTSTAGFER
jgi:hypothetical protein